MSHMTIAASEKAFKELFTLVRDNFTFAHSDGGNFGPFSASYSVAFHLDNGSIHLNADGSVEIEALDVVWDTLKVEVCLELPGFTIPGFCIIPDPWNGCLVGVPDITIGGPVCVPLDLSGLVSEISEVRARLKTKYFVDPGRLPGWSDLDAEFNGKPNKWQIFIDPDFVSVDPIDVPATIGNVFENVVENAIENMIPGPGWLKDLIMAIVGPVIDLIKAALGILDSIEDFIQDLLGDTFDLLGLIETAVADYFANKYPLHELEDPFPILTTGPLIPVKIPLRNLAAQVSSQEMVVTGDVG
ncbi:MAG TPA: hypothetical protein VF322_11575 [Gammaproteobacteria bacterium]